MNERLRLDPPLRKRVYDSIAETIGNTPLVRARRLAAQGQDRDGQGCRDG